MGKKVLRFKFKKKCYVCGEYFLCEHIGRCFCDKCRKSSSYGKNLVLDM